MMNVNVKTKDVALTEEIRSYLDKKLEALYKLIDTNSDSVVCDVELALELNQQNGDVYYAEINLDLPGSKELLRATARGTTILAAIDVAKDEMLRELRKRKTKRLQFMRKGGARIKEMLQERFRG